jgi:sortase A
MDTSAPRRYDSVSSRGITWLERCLWAVSLFLLGYCVFLWGRVEFDQIQGNLSLDELLRRPERVTTPQTDPSEGALFGRIEIPRLDLDAVVFEGTSDGTLARGVGHLTHSAGPGGRGNVVLAGHRDTFFRQLKGIRDGDVVTLTTPAGTFRYAVESTKVVEPTATEVLHPSPDATLTLITCYPFTFIGSAPERFIVRGKRIGSISPGDERT